MRVIQILKRKDGSSVVAAVVIALIAAPSVEGWAAYPSHLLTGRTYAGGGWRNGFWVPLVDLVVELVIFELLTHAYLWLADSQMASKKK